MAGIRGRHPGGTEVEERAAIYDDNITMARFTPFRPEVLGLRAAVRNQPQQATAFTKAVMGMIDRDVFFNPENLQRVMAGAASTAP